MMLKVGMQWNLDIFLTTLYLILFELANQNIGTFKGRDFLKLSNSPVRSLLIGGFNRSQQKAVKKMSKFNQLLEVTVVRYKALW